MWTTMEALGGWGRAGADGAAEAPCARGKHSATLLGGHVYVLGGRGAGGAVPLRDFWRYCLASGRWERLGARGEPPPALQEHSATAHGGRLYVFGGEAGALSGETPLWIYDSEVQLWRKLAGPGAPQHAARRRGREARGAGPRGRRGHSAHSLPDCLLVYGGYQDLRGSTNELWAFHYESESWQQVRTSAAGPARHRHAAALHDNRLYVHGGQCDLRDCADLWHYDTISRVWTQVRARPAPSARSGHAGLRAGAHLYVFGGEAGGQPTNELWRFHFATEAWERIVQGVQWPAPRTDCRALLVAGERAPDRPPRRRTPPAAAAAAPAPAAAPPAGFLREISKLSSFHIRRAARCSYSVLAGERDSTESLVRQDGSSMSKSRSAFVIDERQPADGDESPREADTAERARADLARGRVSVPDFADAAKLVYLDSDEEAEMKREMVSFNTNITKLERGRERKPLPKSASVRFPDSADEGELSTSDYASAERVNRLSAASMGFSNPHYLGPDVRRLGAALTPDSGVAGDIELRDLRRERQPLLLLLVGGREPHHPALLHAPLSLWAYRLL